MAGVAMTFRANQTQLNQIKPHESPLPSEENLCGRVSGEHGTSRGCVSCRECVSWFQASDSDTAEFFLQRLHFHVVVLRGGEVCDG
jgi:hypothetical protein